ncbi:ABC transporter ATP-binding protein [Campylobacter sp. RM10532]|uniref:ABC transporter ATP-binding protein n=1 Tax=Campylobacter molothri TaxID=1032242 RepID=A0ACC5W0Q0_9BACT|nr:ABC transporter ATP-binding protein [Campylobacter sp. RM10542]MBZ7929677.1 ABC transporter ATP-binding protein [Campylobacter sp. W0067]MBZ7930850.1 ABC transporter ATP-binding protein [Campylobacter sp. RM12910]MBZ7932309.1 ABC transporter ATP-binding protein [Campylobacter sp. RM10543]MBZ7936852.1 ABC transporter ATP-binding protein [Campylobacter sp. RM10538]MBZ7940125.1 ABC transporter ATP-binding protein [Campylobacter sp. W0047]MBZ7943581.1 ABC transporter ATP-binding protein [Campy
MKELIKITNLSKNFGKVKALNNINLNVYQGEWLAIMGPSGSGKSTLLNILSLMDTPSSGQYILDGQNLEEINEEQKIQLRREKIGLIFQQFHLIPYLNALENVMLSQYYHSCIDEEDAKMMLEKVGLSHRLSHLPNQLSGGEQQRVCIARSLINNPELLLADEPTGNLDEANEEIVLQTLKKLKNEGKTIVLITHNPDLAKFADRTICLHHGVLK